MAKKKYKLQEAIEIISKMGGIIQTKEALDAGIHPRTLYTLRDQGFLQQISRGIYQVMNSEIVDPDFAVVSKKIKNGVICLISALSFHEMTTQIPHKVYVAVKAGARTPILDYPPVSIYHFSGKAYTEGYKPHRINENIIKIYNAEKTLADCFKFRNQIGLDVFLEAINIYKNRKKIKVNELVKYARICNVEKVMMPYINTLT